MMQLSNLHTHTNFCDGLNSPEEMVRRAIAQNCDSLGFSGHSYTDFNTSYCMSKKGTTEYIKEINRLKLKYSSEIDLFLGVEQDYYSSQSIAPYEYVIGSVHYIKKESNYYPVDESEAITREYVKNCYGGDFYSYVKDYYEIMAGIVKKTNADIIGHFDLVTRFNENNKLFDESDNRYKNAAIEALEYIAKQKKVFEINTGGIYRGYRKNPYPSEFLLKALNDFGGEIIFSSDSHDGASICFMFNEMAELAKYCGFKYIKTFTKSGFTDIEL